MKPILTSLAVALVSLLMHATGAHAQGERDTALLSDGRTFDASLVEIDADREMLIFERDGRPIETPIVDLVRWGRLASPRRGAAVVVLTGGERYVGDCVNTDAGLQIDGATRPTVVVPIERVAGVLFDWPGEPINGERRVFELLDAKADGVTEDVCVLKNGDVVRGTFLDLTATSLEMETTLGTVSTPRERVDRLTFNPLLAEPSDPGGVRIIAGYDDGSRIATWPSDSATPCYLASRGGRIAYLSDLRPVEDDQTPLLELERPYKNDRSVSGGPLSVGGTLYPKGLGVHARQRLRYAVPEGAVALQAAVAIDDATQGRGSVSIRVTVDGRVVFQRDAVRGGEPPVRIAVPLAPGAAFVDLLVDFGERGDVQDHVDWLAARFVLAEQ